MRNVVAECLGRLAAQDPARLMPELRSRLDTSTDAETRATAVTAVKYAVLSAPAAALPAIAESLPAFLCAGTITVGAYTRSHFRST